MRTIKRKVGRKGTKKNKSTKRIIAKRKVTKRKGTKRKGTKRIIVKRIIAKRIGTKQKGRKTMRGGVTVAERIAAIEGKEFFRKPVKIIPKKESEKRLSDQINQVRDTIKNRATLKKAASSPKAASLSKKNNPPRRELIRGKRGTTIEEKNAANEDVKEALSALSELDKILGTFPDPSASSKKSLSGKKVSPVLAEVVAAVENESAEEVNNNIFELINATVYKSVEVLPANQQSAVNEVMTNAFYDANQIVNEESVKKNSASASSRSRSNKSASINSREFKPGGVSTSSFEISEGSIPFKELPLSAKDKLKKVWEGLIKALKKFFKKRTNKEKSGKTVPFPGHGVVPQNIYLPGSNERGPYPPVDFAEGVYTATPYKNASPTSSEKVTRFLAGVKNPNPQIKKNESELAQLKNEADENKKEADRINAENAENAQKKENITRELSGLRKRKATRVANAQFVSDMDKAWNEHLEGSEEESPYLEIEPTLDENDEQDEQPGGRYSAFINK